MDWRSRLSSFEEHEPLGSYFLIIWDLRVPFPFAIMNTTIPTETELSSVNSILMALGQAPINRIFNDENGQLVYVNPEVALCHSLLMEVNTDVQNEGWVFNREGHYPLTPEADGTITVPNAILRMDVWENDIYRSSNLVQREGKLYDKLHHTYEFPPNKAIYFDIVWKWNYEDLPSAFKRYITLRAASRAAAQLITNPKLVELLSTQEAAARATCMEYECNQGDHTFFGTPEGTAYRPYQPYRTLAR